MKLHYSIVIEWSGEDSAFLVTLPNLDPNRKLTSATYKEAVKRAQEVMETLVEFYQEQGRALPKPKNHGVKRTKGTKKPQIA